jgi:glyoxylase-like metal-dependent hydrolase (beta-lactamase superfamily II)
MENMSNQRRYRIWIGGAVFFLIVVVLVFASDFRKPSLQIPVIDGTTTTVVAGVHLIGGLGPSASYAVETTEGLILIDTGLDDDATKLKAELESLGLDWKSLRAVFLTHVHGDHCGGAERLRAETGARIYAGQRDAAAIESGLSRDAFFSIFPMPNHSPHATHVDEPLQGGESISIGDVTIETIDTPGHTPGSVCYLVEYNGLRILFSGDVIYRLGDNPLGTYSAYLAPRYRSDVREFLASLKKLRNLTAPDLVLPGHPAASRAPHSPRLSSQEWNTMLGSGIQEMEQLIARFDVDGANFLDDVPKQLVPGVFYFGDFHGTAVYGLYFGSEFAIINAPGGAGLCEFLEQRQDILKLPPTKPNAVLLTACGEREIAGLKKLVEDTQASVYVAEPEMELIRSQCPSGTVVLSTKDLDKSQLPAVTPVELGRPGTTLIAYVLQSSGKTILISSTIPTGGNRTVVGELISRSGKSSLTPSDFVNVLRRLLQFKPDLWLPAVPVNGQNANLYDEEWKSVLGKDYDAVHELFLSGHSP